MCMHINLDKFENTSFSLHFDLLSTRKARSYLPLLSEIHGQNRVIPIKICVIVSEGEKNSLHWPTEREREGGGMGVLILLSDSLSNRFLLITSLRSCLFLLALHHLCPLLLEREGAWSVTLSLWPCLAQDPQKLYPGDLDRWPLSCTPCHLNMRQFDGCSLQRKWLTLWKENIY